MAACGGGGGGSTENAAPSADRFFIQSDFPGRIHAEIFEKQTFSPGGVRVQGYGDVSFLQGQTLHVLIEDPDALLLPRTEQLLSLDPPQMSLELHGRQLDTTGVREGEFKLHVCLDAACHRPLAGSPIRIPYRVEVLPGIRVNPEIVEVTLPFGTIPEPIALEVTMPKGGRLLEATAPTPGAVEWASIDTTASGPTRTVTLRLAPAGIGVHEETARLRVDHHFQTLDRFEKEVLVRYTVTPAPEVLHVFWPSAAKYQLNSNGSTPRLTLPSRLLLAPGVTAQFSGVEYLSQPDSAANHPQANAWWDQDVQFPMICGGRFEHRTCLPPGTYTARVRYALVKDGTTHTVHLPLIVEVGTP
jgi:hypothetical protein